MTSDYQENKKSRVGVYYAFNGIKLAFKTEINMRVHSFIMIIVLLLGFVFSVSNIEWVLLLLTIGLVITAEVFNTAVEHMLDYLAPEIHPAVGAIKDLTAGAVLVTSIVALLVGVIIFLPKIMTLLV